MAVIWKYVALIGLVHGLSVAKAQSQSSPGGNEPAQNSDASDSPKLNEDSAAESASNPDRSKRPDPTTVGDDDDPNLSPNTSKDDARATVVGDASLGKPFSSWKLDGKLRDKPEALRIVFEPVVERLQGLSSTARNDLVRFAGELDYQVANLSVRNGVLSIELKPAMLVRHLIISVSDQHVINSLSHTLRWVFTLGQTSQADSGLILREDVEKRVRIRPGAVVPVDEDEQKQLLEQERIRVLTYLRQQGYGEAEVELAFQKKKEFANLKIGIKRGPRYRLGTVTVRNNNAVPSSLIRKQFEIEQKLLAIPLGKKPFTMDSHRQGLQKIKKLYHERGFPGVRIESGYDIASSFNKRKKEIEFALNVRERRQIDVVFSVDTNRFPDDQLREQLTFTKEQAYDDVEIENSAASLADYMQLKGYFEARVSWTRKRIDNPKRPVDRITFTIKQGQELRVRSIRVEGNKQLPTSQLESRISTTTYGVLSGGYTTASQLRRDARAIQSLYRSRGFANAMVNVEAVRSKSMFGVGAVVGATYGSQQLPNELHVKFTVDEGQPTTIKNVTVDFAGKHRMKASDIVSMIPGKKGRRFEPYKFDGVDKRIATWYAEKGYIDARIETKIERQGADANITVSVEERPLSKLGKVVFRGNFKTKQWILRDELGLEEGQELTLSAQARARENLRATNLFRSIELKRISGSSSGMVDQANMLVRVQEAHDIKAAMEIAGGYTTDIEAAFAEFNVNTQNWLGLGIRGSLNAQTALGIEAPFADYNNFHTLESTIELPQWIGRKVTGFAFDTELNGYQRLRQSDRFGDLKRLGASLAISKTWRYGTLRGVRLGVRYGIRQWNRDQDLIRPSGANEDLTSVPVRTRTETVGTSLTIDKRKRNEVENFISPNEGFRLQFDADYATTWLFGGNTFLKFGAAGQVFWSPTSRLVISNHLRYNHGVPLGGAVLLPEVERYFAGGNTDVRGFEEDRVLTEVIEDPLAPLSSVSRYRVIPAGGNVRIIHNLDAQINLIGPWSGVIFFDTGLVTNSLDNITLRQFRHSAGIGIRLSPDVLRLSLEYAIPLDPGLGDDPRGRLHIRVGLIF